jgi:hypothetical protein
MDFFLVGDFTQPHSTGAGSFFLALEACDTRVDPEDRTWAGKLPLASATTSHRLGSGMEVLATGLTCHMISVSPKLIIGSYCCP